MKQLLENYKIIYKKKKKNFYLKMNKLGTSFAFLATNAVSKTRSFIISIIFMIAKFFPYN